MKCRLSLVHWYENSHGLGGPGPGVQRLEQTAMEILSKWHETFLCYADAAFMVDDFFLAIIDQFRNTCSNFFVSPEDISEKCWVPPLLKSEIGTTLVSSSWKLWGQDSPKRVAS